MSADAGRALGAVKVSSRPKERHAINRQRMPAAGRTEQRSRSMKYQTERRAAAGSMLATAQRRVGRRAPRTRLSRRRPFVAGKRGADQRLRGSVSLVFIPGERTCETPLCRSSFVVVGMPRALALVDAVLDARQTPPKRRRSGGLRLKRQSQLLLDRGDRTRRAGGPNVNWALAPPAPADRETEERAQCFIFRKPNVEPASRRSARAARLHQ